MNGCGLVSMGLVAKQLCGSNGQSRLLQSPCNFLHMPHLWTRLEMLVPFLEVGLSKLSEFLHINMSDFDIPLKINIGVRAHTFEPWNAPEDVGINNP